MRRCNVHHIIDNPQQGIAGVLRCDFAKPTGEATSAGRSPWWHERSRRYWRSASKRRAVPRRYWCGAPEPLCRYGLTRDFLHLNWNCLEPDQVLIVLSLRPTRIISQAQSLWIIMLTTCLSLTTASVVNSNLQRSSGFARHSAITNGRYPSAPTSRTKKTSLLADEQEADET